MTLTVLHATARRRHLRRRLARHGFDDIDEIEMPSVTLGIIHTRLRRDGSATHGEIHAYLPDPPLPLP